MKINKFFLIILIFFIILNPLTMGIGLSPPQLRIENGILGAKSRVATLVVVNTESEPVFLVMRVSSLSHERPQKLRVICLGCNRHVGIQRGDLIYPAKIIQLNERETYITDMGVTLIFGVNATVEYKTGKTENVFIPSISNHSYNIGDYTLVGNNVQYTLVVPETNISFVRHGNYVFKKIGEKEALLNKNYCPFCGASEEHMIFYDFPPTDVLNNVTLTCNDYPLEPYLDGYLSNVTVPAGGSVNIDIWVNISDIKEHYDKHWEVRIMATMVSNLSLLTSFIVYGAETKFLIDTPQLPPELADEGFNFIPFILAGIGGVVVVAIVVFYLVKAKETIKEKPSPLGKPLTEKKHKKSIDFGKGRKIL